MLEHRQTLAAEMLHSLSRLGVRRIFGIVGREADSILFDECDDVEFVLTHHEANAGFMAIAMSRFTGTPQVCFSTLGPGSTNLATALATARLDRYPLICIAAQIETHEMNYNFAHQCVDGVGINAPVSKFSYELKPGDDIDAILRKAFGHALRPPAGPAFISIPNDVLKYSVDVDREIAPWPSDDVGGVLPTATAAVDVAGLTAAAGIINAAAHPLLIVGDSATRNGCAEAVQAFAQGTGIPVASSYSAKGVLGPDDPLYLGAITPHADSFLEYPALEEIFGPTDCLVLLGYDLAEHLLPQVWAVGEPKRIVRIGTHENPNPTQLQPDLDVLVDSTEHALRELSEQVTSRSGHHSIDRLRRHVAAMAADERPGSDGSFLPQQVVSELNAHYGDYILANDVGFHRHISALFFRAQRPLDFVTSAGLSSFGTGLPFGIGAKLANPGRHVVVITGDVGFHSSSAELETAVRLGVQLTVVVYQNSRSALIERYQEQGHGRVNSNTTAYGLVDFAALARAHGCHGTRVESRPELRAALMRADEFSGTSVIELPVDYPNNYLNEFTRNFHAR